MTPAIAPVRAKDAHSQRLRGLLLFAMLLGFMETVLYTALAPIIPGLVRDPGLSTTQVGTLTAAYPAGIVLASVPVGYAASRVAPRSTAVVGLWVLALASVGFAFGHTAGELYLARFLQGAGSAAAWGGALAWLAGVYPVADRGGTMGLMFSAAFVGVLLGPTIGAVAATAGRQSTFSVIGLGLAIVALWRGPRHLSTPRSNRERALMAGLRHPALAILLVCIVTLGVVGGTLNTLGPLLLAEHGLGAGGIAACFIAAGVPQVLFTSALGRRLGQSGLVPFCVAMLLLSAVLVPLTTVPTGRLTTAVLFSVVLGVEWMIFNPLLLLLSSVAERFGTSQGLAMSLGNGAWGLGAAAGGVLLAKVAQATSISDALVAAGLIAFLVGTGLAAAWRAGILSVDRAKPGSQGEPASPSVP